MKFILFTFFNCLLVTQLFPQKKQSDQSTGYRYLTKEGIEVTDLKEAAIIRVFMGIDSAREMYEVRDYTPTGQIIATRNSSSPYYLKLQGPSVWFNSKKRPVKTGTYTDGKPSGQWIEYYDNGAPKVDYTYLTPQEIKFKAQQDNYRVNNSWDSTGVAEVTNGNGIYKLRDDITNAVLSEGPVKNGLHEGLVTGFSKSGRKKYEEEYKDGKLVKGTSFDEDGSQVPYDTLWVQPSFPGGNPALNRFLRRTIRYPDSAMAKRYSGIVVIQFTVDTTGQMRDIEVHEGSHNSLNEEALRVAKLTKNWIPGKIRGRKAAYIYYLPIKFELGN